MKRTILVGFAVAVLAGHPAYAAEDDGFTGNELYDMCQDQPGSYASGACMGFVAGLAHTLNWGLITGLDNMCFGGSTPAQWSDVVEKYLREHPETRHMPAVLHTIAALREAFKCFEPAPAKPG